MRIIILAVVIICLFLFSRKKIFGGGLSPEIADLIKNKSYQWGVDRALIKAHCFVESAFNPRAKNPADPSYGLMQVTPALAYDFGLIVNWKDPSSIEIDLIYNPAFNLDVACWFIARLHKELPFDGAIQAYNVGLSGYKKGRRNSVYLKRVRKYYAKYS